MKFLVVLLAVAAVACAQEARDKRGVIGLGAPAVLAGPSLIHTARVAPAVVAAPGLVAGHGLVAPGLVAGHGLVAPGLLAGHGLVGPGIGAPLVIG